MFRDVAGESGLDFVHSNFHSGPFYLHEIMGSGVGLLDYDNDGDLDVYVVQGAPVDALDGEASPRDRLYRNDLDVENGVAVARFTDVTEESGITAFEYGMGVTAGDFDADGRVDLYVTNFGPNQLWHNDGDGRFTEVTEASGTGCDAWSVSAAFVDVDGDGLLDLYVGNYVDFTIATHKECVNLVRDYCSPLSYRPVPDRLFRNRGDGTFQDITAISALASAYGNGLGVVSADFNLDGKIDLYVANDGTPNQCWINTGVGHFKEMALLAGCALNDQGQAEAGMGVTAADFDGDGDEDLFVTHLRGETNTLYVNDGNAIFRDETIRSGLGSPSKPRTGFGTIFMDYDNDGLLDLFAVNGAVTAIEALVQAGDPYPFHEPNQLFRNQGAAGFVEIDVAAFAVSEISRGAATGDIDNDGDIDLVVAQVNGPVRLMLNEAGNRNHWLGLRMVTGSPHRDVPGTRVAVLRDGEDPLWKRVRTDGSYASSSDSRLHFGLGDDAASVTVRASWPDGLIEQWSDLTVDRFVTLERATGEAVH